MTETVELRKKPELKFILNTDEFDIVDASEPKNNGTYSYAEIKKAELNAERTDWFISTLSHIADFLMGSAVGGNFKNKANLKLKLNNRTLKIWLIDADFKKVERITELIKNKKPTHNNVLY
ncbi:hypothetical protein [Hwangdonia lutea]|uniref:Uncharacterized protein n=1 Tax=Hwangdonia lutea TaxID=3075823 RepID=A0AA97EJ42_9FLAO|nr:hypothetical protein [Hwangdonia sp. SCSIO 19198]WOD42389.1 hypothetical protein RNZ46_10315 [Hwangdonia sp. SCSIO 19198]